MTNHIKFFNKKTKTLIEEFEITLPSFIAISEAYDELENKIPLTELIVFYYSISENRDWRECGSIVWKNSKRKGAVPIIKESKLFFLSKDLVSNSSYPIDTKRVGTLKLERRGESYKLNNNKFALNNSLMVFNPYEFVFLGYIPDHWTK